MEPKPGIKTTEFWLTAATNIAGAVIAILAAYGLIKQEHSALWLSLTQSLAVAVVPIALAIINYAYISSRGKVKAQQ